MEIKTKTINNRTYTLVNEFIDKRDGFNHRSVLFKNGVEVARNNVHYINRTWECYNYQTSMRGAVNIYLDDLLTRYLHAYKITNKVKHFKKGEKEQVIEEFKALDEIKELYALKDAIETRDFD